MRVTHSIPRLHHQFAQNVVPSIFSTLQQTVVKSALNVSTVNLLQFATTAKPELEHAQHVKKVSGTRRSAIENAQLITTTKSVLGTELATSRQDFAIALLLLSQDFGLDRSALFAILTTNQRFATSPVHAILLRQSKSAPVARDVSMANVSAALLSVFRSISVLFLRLLASLAEQHVKSQIPQSAPTKSLLDARVDSRFRLRVPLLALAAPQLHATTTVSAIDFSENATASLDLAELIAHLQLLLAAEQRVSSLPSMLQLTLFLALQHISLHLFVMVMVSA
jgi:hypothetical protein